MKEKKENLGVSKMAIIEVEEKDLDKVFEILSDNGRFTGLENNRFRIDEHAEAVLKKIKEAGIIVKLIDDKNGSCSGGVEEE